MKKFKRFITDFAPILIGLLLTFFTLWLSKTIFEAIINSNMPDWVKYILLK